MADQLAQYYLDQSGTGLSYFTGTRFQRGSGIGSFFSKIFKTAILPLLKKGGKYAAEEALKTGLDIGKDILEGGNIKQSAKARSKEAGDRILKRLESKMQTGSGIKVRGRKYLNQYKPRLSYNEQSKPIRSSNKLSSRELEQLDLLTKQLT